MAFKIENIFIGFSLFVLIIVLGTTFISEGLGTYNITGDTSPFGDISTTLSTSYQNNILGMKSNLEGGTVTDQDAVNQMIYGGYTGIRNNPFAILSTSLNITNIVIDKSQMFNPIFSTIMYGILVCLLVFAIIYLIFRFRSG